MTVAAGIVVVAQLAKKIRSAFRIDSPFDDNSEFRAATVVAYFRANSTLHELPRSPWQLCYQESSMNLNKLIIVAHTKFSRRVEGLYYRGGK